MGLESVQQRPESYGFIISILYLQLLDVREVSCPERFGSDNSLFVIGDLQRTPGGEVTLRQSQVEQGGGFAVSAPREFQFLQNWGASHT